MVKLQNFDSYLVLNIRQLNIIQLCSSVPNGCLQYLLSHRRSALSAVRPGGIVVYSTCTLSSSENYTVVEMVLNDCPDAEPEDLREEFAVSLSKYFTFSPAHPGHGGQTLHKPSPQLQNGNVSSYRRRLGILVVPQPGKTWGPMFLSRIRRRK